MKSLKTTEKSSLLQGAIQGLLDRFVSEKSERGLQVAVYLDGALVVDAFAGASDSAGNRAVDGDTLFPVFSTTKGMMATLAHLVVERGQMDYETPIARVWPEFGAHGKGGITLRHALSHTEGLPFLPVGLDHAQLNDWRAMCEAMADETPISAPGMEMVYHPVTYGWIVGEVVRRADGRPPGQMLREEIGLPLGMTDSIFIGLPHAEEERVAWLSSDYAPEPEAPEPQGVPHWMKPLHEWMNRSDARQGCHPGSNGIMTARAVARHYAALLPGGVDGIKLLSPERRRVATEVQKPRNARNEPPPLKQGLGYQLGLFAPESFGHAGYGGSIGFADPASRLALGFARNHFGAHEALPPILDELRRFVNQAV